MPYQKLKNEQYHNFGGINTKVSPYASGPEEFLNLINCDFNSPGALQKRPGSTQYLTSGVSGRVVGLYEFQSLSGASYPIIGANTHLYYVAANTPTQITAGLQDSALLSFATFVDRLFFANGANFMKWKAGGTAFLYSLPEPVPFAGPNISSVGATNIHWPSATMTFSVDYINDRGFLGPVTNNPANANNIIFYSPSNFQKDYYYFQFGVTNAAGITYCPLICNSFFGTTTYFVAAASYGVGFTTGMTFVDPTTGIPSGSTTSFYGMGVYRDSGPGTARFRVDYLQVLSVNGSTFFAQDISATYCFYLGAQDALNEDEPSNVNFTLMPRWMDIYNNQLMMAGFSATPSVVWFSDIGEPESVQPTNNFEVRTNDGDVVTGLRAYLSQLVIFKEKSFHVLAGDDPTNFSLREISDQYGCISGRAITTYENTMVFLDRKGIVEYNGANYQIISNKLESYFQTMNLTAARDNAVMIHNKVRNQIWTGIPVNGSTLNNLTIVYDYLLNAWTTFDGFNPSSLAMIKADQSTEVAFYGAYSSGAIYNFSPSFFGDNGSGITTLIKTRFFADLGESTQKQFRRFYANVDQSGSSTLIKIELSQDYGSSVVLSSTLSLQPFQSRIDFGISGRALSAQLSNFSATETIRLHGFTIAHRFQRDV